MSLTGLSVTHATRFSLSPPSGSAILAAGAEAPAGSIPFALWDGKASVMSCTPASPPPPPQEGVRVLGSDCGMTTVSVYP